MSGIYEAHFHWRGNLSPGSGILSRRTQADFKQLLGIGEEDNK